MPTYDYKCIKCGYKFEMFHRITETPKVFCPKCKGESAKQISLNSGVIFKGSGFYITDYKNKSTVATSSNTKKEKTSEPTSVSAKINSMEETSRE